MPSTSSTRLRIRSGRRSLTQSARIVLLMLALISTPFQYALANCNCAGCLCCTPTGSIECCDEGVSCCSTITNDADVDRSEACCSSCFSCGTQCQCGAVEITPSNHYIGQTDSVDAPLLPSALVLRIANNNLPVVQAAQISFTDLASVRLHAFLCVWLN